MTILKLADKHSANSGFSAQIFLRHVVFEPKLLHSTAETSSCIPLHSSKVACIPSDTTLPIGYIMPTDSLTPITEKKVPRRASLPKTIQLAIFRRDGWLCGWCKKPVIFAPVLKYLEIELQACGFSGPLAYYHPHWTRATAPLLDELGAVLDHVNAFSAGGPCDEDNLLTACAKCNGRKGPVSLKDWEARPIRRPIKGKYGEPTAWDGLSTAFIMLADRHRSLLNAGERDWLQAFAVSPAPLAHLGLNAEL